ncbi:YaiO family outer membrane beta-barrel protein [uncultured Arcticibacterium sp.]|uniref:YaiO family outer membrane beta-barrel protein n=1 Tax=uncultured Arcticibacterium sp. TaxID=2173042 RepID=UPI0030F7532D
MNKIILLLSFLLLSQFLMAQEDSFDPDDEFAKAREMAFNGKRTEAIETLKKVVAKYPTYGDVRLFLASVYGWEDKYKLAREEYEILLEQDNADRNYWIGYIKNELYSEQAMSALDLARQALILLPNDVDLVLLKARAEKNNNNLSEASETVKEFLKVEPHNVAAKEFLSGLKEDMATNTISISFSGNHFSEIYDPMLYSSLSYSKDTKIGGIVGRLNINRKFNTYGSQIEIDAYPSITEGLYAYLNVGYSKSTIFPNFRYGAQLYKSLPKSFEVSVGIRSLKYTEYTNIYTGSIGKYFGNSFITFVPYFIPSDEGWSKSGTFTYRNYGANGDQFLAVSVGLGFSPEINRFGLDPLNEPTIDLKSQKLGISKSFRIKNNNNVAGIGISASRQESIFDPGEFIIITSLSLSYSLSY